MSPFSQGLFLFVGSLFAWGQGGSALEVIWRSDAQVKILKTFTPAEMRNWKSTSNGVLFSKILEKSVQELSGPEKAKIDLVVLKNLDGKETPIPRAFVQKYPFVLSFEKKSEGEGMASRIPASRDRRLNEEVLPLGNFETSGIATIELTNYREKYGQDLFLARRTDPQPLLGEKRFMQNCMGCHRPTPERGPAEWVRTLHEVAQSTSVHAKVQAMPRFGNTDRDALLKYVEEIQKQNPTWVQTGKSSGMAQRDRHKSGI